MAQSNGPIDQFIGHGFGKNESQRFAPLATEVVTPGKCDSSADSRGVDAQLGPHGSAAPVSNLRL
jgi:hypothetical protein